LINKYLCRLHWISSGQKPGLQEQADPSSSAWHDFLGS